MTKASFRILDGGQSLDIEQVDRHFISAYVTDTRLMGVLAVYAHWHLDSLGTIDPGRQAAAWGDLHQFFYIDCEESGLETCQTIRVSDAREVEDAEQALIGGLGASRIDLDETELRQLISFWYDFDVRRGIPVPEPVSDYRFLVSDEMIPDARQRRALMAKICPEIVSDHQLINYFLMRCFGRDHEGAAWLAEDTVPVDLYDRYQCATFCRNVIDPVRTDVASGVYLCESLVEADGHYDTVISRVVTKDLRVSALEYCSHMSVSETEAAMILKKSEFVTVYDIRLTPDQIESNIGEFSIGFHATMSRCENGRLFMSFRPNNDYVNERIFLLSNDVRGIYFVTDHGQLITAAYSREGIRELEQTVRRSILAPYLLPVARFEFKEPVLYEFMHSDIDYFETFLEMLGEDD